MANAMRTTGAQEFQAEQTLLPGSADTATPTKPVPAASVCTPLQAAADVEDTIVADAPLIGVHRPIREYGELEPEPEPEQEPEQAEQLGLRGRSSSSPRAALLVDRLMSVEQYAVDERGKHHRLLNNAASREFCDLSLENGGLELSVEYTDMWVHFEQRQRKHRSPDRKAASAYLEGTAGSPARGPQHVYDDPVYRRVANSVIAAHVLEVLVVVSIVVNTVILMLQHPQNDLSSTFNQTLRVINFILTCVFTAEMCIRIAALGFHTAASPLAPAYLHDGWNRMDFAVVLVSWVSVFYDMVQPAGVSGDLSGLLQSLSALRLLRFLRVIKSISFFADTGAILKTLSGAVASSVNILGFLGFVFLVAGIVGLQMFSGMLKYRCSTTAPKPDASAYDWSPGMGLGIQHTTCMPVGHNLCPERECPGVYLYPGHDPHQLPVLANMTDAGCPPCFAD